MKDTPTEQISYLEQRLAFAENRLRDLTSRVSDLAPQVLSSATLHDTQSQEVLTTFAEQIIREITDPDPDFSLTTSTRIPCAVVRSGLFRGPIYPQEKWAEVVSSFPAMPSTFQEAIKKEKLKASALPSWRQIENLFKLSGFQAIPVYRAVGNLLFQQLISQKKFPVCTEWMMRFSVGPRLTIGDTFHEIGHAFSLIQEDYRKIAVHFAQLFLKTDLPVFGKDIFLEYVRALENCYVYEPNGNVTPIGPTSYSLDSIRLQEGRLQPRRPTKNTNSLAHRPYDSHHAWIADCDRLIQRCHNADLTRSQKLSGNKHSDLHEIS